MKMINGLLNFSTLILAINILAAQPVYSKSITTTFNIIRREDSSCAPHLTLNEVSENNILKQVEFIQSFDEDRDEDGKPSITRPIEMPCSDLNGNAINVHSGNIKCTIQLT